MANLYDMYYSQAMNHALRTRLVILLVISGQIGWSKPLSAMRLWLVIITM